MYESKFYAMNIYNQKPKNTSQPQRASGNSPRRRHVYPATGNFYYPGKGYLLFFNNKKRVVVPPPIPPNYYDIDQTLVDDYDPEYDSEEYQYEHRFDPEIYDGTYEPDGSGIDYDYDDNGYGDDH